MIKSISRKRGSKGHEAPEPITGLPWHVCIIFTLPTFQNTH